MVVSLDTSSGKEGKSNLDGMIFHENAERQVMLLAMTTEEKAVHVFHVNTVVADISGIMRRVFSV